jgi:hypothetical protein
MFKDAVPLFQNDEFYLVTDTEGNTDTELLQKKLNVSEWSNMYLGLLLQLDSTIKIQLSMLG